MGRRSGVVPDPAIIAGLLSYVPPERVLAGALSHDPKSLSAFCRKKRFIDP